jgi:phosphoglycolate phosphatase
VQPPVPELVIFDVDGTLNGVELWWPDLIRSGVRRFADALGLELTEPDDRAALMVVGEADADVWSPFLPPDQQHRWDELRAMVLPMEVDLLRSGRDFLYPGVREVLKRLREVGVKLALASNCGADYMAAIRDGQGLGDLTDWQFCLDSPGVVDKADMLREAMATAGSERAVMVGDRWSDQRAAVAAGVPFYWRANDLCRIDEAAGTWHGDPDGLLSLLGLPRISSSGAE